MLLPRNNSFRWLVFFVCLFLGTLLGVFLQRFQATGELFRDVGNLSAAVERVDLLIVHAGFYVGFRVNLGTLLGGLMGIWAAR